MYRLPGLRTRESFDGVSQLSNTWVFDRKKYDTPRKEWRVYRRLLLFYMCRDAVPIPLDVVIVILREAFLRAVHDRIEDARQYGWRSIGTRQLTMEGRRIKKEVSMLWFDPAWRVSPDLDVTDGEKKIYGLIAFSFTHKDGVLVDNETFFIRDCMLCDEWMMSRGNNKYDDEMYRLHRDKVYGRYAFFFSIVLLWFYDTVYAFQYSQSIGDMFFPLFCVVDAGGVPNFERALVETLLTIFSLLLRTVLNPFRSIHTILTLMNNK